MVVSENFEIKNVNFKLKKINPNHLIKFLVTFKFNSLKNLVKDFVRMYPCAIDFLLLEIRFIKI